MRPITAIIGRSYTVPQSAQDVAIQYVMRCMYMHTLYDYALTACYVGMAASVPNGSLTGVGGRGEGHSAISSL